MSFPVNGSVLKMEAWLPSDDTGELRLWGPYRNLRSGTSVFPRLLLVVTEALAVWGVGWGVTSIFLVSNPRNWKKASSWRGEEEGESNWNTDRWRMNGNAMLARLTDKSCIRRDPGGPTTRSRCINALCCASCTSDVRDKSRRAGMKGRTENRGKK